MEPNQPWVKIIKGTCLASNGIEIEYIAPIIIDGEIEVMISEQDIESYMIYWEHSLVIYALGQASYRWMP